MKDKSTDNKSFLNYNYWVIQIHCGSISNMNRGISSNDIFQHLIVQQFEVLFAEDFLVQGIELLISISHGIFTVHK